MNRKNKFNFYALKLCGLMFVVFLIQLFVDGFTELFLLDSNASVQVWRFITAIFLHGGFAHLLYNLFALALFGSMLERLIGSWRFLIVFLFTGVGANFNNINFFFSFFGAFGGVFWILGG